jgi:hypothetical protein
MFEEYVVYIHGTYMERGEKLMGNVDMFIKNCQQVFQGLGKLGPQKTLEVPNRTETNCYKNPQSEVARN